MTAIGHGTKVSGSETEGVLHAANNSEQVFALMKHEKLDEVILLTESASATAVVPLMARVRGIVCRSGGVTSHIAIVSREFGIPCVMSAELPADDELEGARIAITADGGITRVG